MSASSPRRDRLIPYYIVAFFLFIALVDGIMVTLAVRTQTGLVTEHPYEKGLAYNEVVNASNQQQAAGWKGEILFTPGTSTNGELQFVLRDAGGVVVEPESLTASITRPTQAGMDFEVNLENGVKTPISFPVTGIWEVRIHALYQQKPYQQSRRIVVE